MKEIENLNDTMQLVNKLCNNLESMNKRYLEELLEKDRKIISMSVAEDGYIADENIIKKMLRLNELTGVDNSVADVHRLYESKGYANDEIRECVEELAEAFEAAIGDDGTIYAEYTGTITDLSYEAGDTISSGATVATFSNADAVTITVSVSEEDITNIAVGDVVEIELSAYEDQTFAGEVESIDTSSSSGSSTVSYNVTAAFTGDITGIYTDMTGNGCAVCIQQGGPV